MNNTPFTIAVSLLWALAAGGLAWYVGQAALEIRYVTLADGRLQERKLPLLFRLLLPLAPNLTGWLGRPTFAREREQIEKRLTASGYEGLLDAPSFMALRLLVPLVGGPVLIALTALALQAIPGGPGEILRQRQITFYVILMLLLYLHPTAWLRGAIRQRHRAFERALPFVLDLLTLSVEAGLDFMSGLKRILEHRAMDPLGEELLRTQREVQVGKTRREALRMLGQRAQHPDISAVVNALVQADELGVSLGAILRIQADQMRVRRFQRAEKLAQEAPVKLLFPLVAFIFPAVFIVLLGPVLLELLRHQF
jgi:tight adherence protein C